MRTYQARRDNPVTGDEQVVYITDAADISLARAALRRHGWDSARELSAVPPGFDLPEEATMIRAPAAVRPAAVADSILFDRLTWRIALGICFGMLLYTLALTVFGWLIGVMDNAF